MTEITYLKDQGNIKKGTTMTVNSSIAKILIAKGLCKAVHTTKENNLVIK